jgi:hypothetical protein
MPLFEEENLIPGIENSREKITVYIPYEKHWKNIW